MTRLLLAFCVVLVAPLVLPPLWYAVVPVSHPELPPAGRRVDVSTGLGVNVIEEGVGPPVVLVHGHPGCAYDWEPFMRELAGRGLRAIAYDRVGYGRSDARPRGRVTVETNARELLGLLAGPVLSWISRVPPVGRRLRAAFLRTAFHPDAVPDWFLRLAEANLARPGTLDAFRSEGRDLGGEADLDPAPIQLPILVFQGDADRLVPPAVAENIRARALHAELRIVPHAGHALPITHTALLADALAEFAGPTGR